MMIKIINLAGGLEKGANITPQSSITLALLRSSSQLVDHPVLLPNILTISYHNNLPLPKKTIHMKKVLLKTPTSRVSLMRQPPVVRRFCA